MQQLKLTNLNEVGIIIFIPRLSTVPERWVFPIEVETIEMILSEKLDCVFNKFLSSTWISDHRWKSAGSLVPSTNGQHGFQVFIVGFESGELGISTLKQQLPWYLACTIIYWRFLALMCFLFLTFLDVLVLVKWLQRVVLGETTEGVNQVGA